MPSILHLRHIGVSMEAWEEVRIMGLCRSQRRQKVFACICMEKGEQNSANIE